MKARNLVSANTLVDAISSKADSSNPFFELVRAVLLNYQESVLNRVVRSSKKMPSGCIEWQGFISEKGYGKIWLRFQGIGRFTYAHRVSYALFVGPIGDLQVCHSCDNRRCISPSHLWLGTNEENVRDMIAKGRNAIPSNAGNQKRCQETGRFAPYS